MQGTESLYETGEQAPHYNFCCYFFIKNIPVSQEFHHQS